VRPSRGRSGPSALAMQQVLPPVCAVWRDTRLPLFFVVRDAVPRNQNGGDAITKGTKLDSRIDTLLQQLQQVRRPRADTRPGIWASNQCCLHTQSPATASGKAGGIPVGKQAVVVWGRTLRYRSCWRSEADQTPTPDYV
jgi:hypothetical protein